MLEITIPKSRYFDEDALMFIYINEFTLKLEHSLIAIQRWESKHHKPFLGTKKTTTELIDYIRYMTINPIKDQAIYNFIPSKYLVEISEYIKDPMSARIILEKEGEGSFKSETITYETIYYWMISLGIPVEFQKWHINQLLSLIRFMNNRQNPKKIPKEEAARMRMKLNEERRKALNSKG